MLVYIPIIIGSMSSQEDIIMENELKHQSDVEWAAILIKSGLYTFSDSIKSEMFTRKCACNQIYWECV